MHVNIDILDPIPPRFGYSYGNMFFGKYGVCAWEYPGGYWGPIHWINWRKSYFRPEYPQPQKFHYWFYPQVIGRVKVDVDIRDDVPDILMGTTVVNLLNGKGIPIRAPQ